MGIKKKKAFNTPVRSYPDWSPTLSSVLQGTRVIAAISVSNFVSNPRTSVTNAFVMTAENSSYTAAQFKNNPK